MDFDQKLNLDHSVNVVGLQLEYSVDYLYLDNYNQLLFAGYVVLMWMHSMNWFVNIKININKYNNQQ